MSTRLYLPASTASTPISPTPDADWEDTSILGRAITRKLKIANAMATVSFTDNNAANRDVLFRQFISLPLEPNQTVTGGQQIQLQMLASEVGAGNNMFLDFGIRVIAADGTTIRKTVLALTRDDTELIAGTLTNRQHIVTGAATDYTTVVGDRLCIEIGTGGDPAVGSDHDSDIRFGDAAASDLVSDDTSTTDNNPWIEFTDTLAFDDRGHGNVQVSTRRFIVPRATTAAYEISPRGTGGGAIAVDEVVSDLPFRLELSSRVDTHQRASTTAYRLKSETFIVPEPYPNIDLMGGSCGV